MTPRRFAVRFLQRLFSLPLTLGAVVEDPHYQAFGDADRRLALELIYGTLRHRERLDYYVRHLSRRPLSRLDPEILWILRVALYQLEFLRVPHHAAVHEAVGLCRDFRKASAAGFVNALLRRFLRERPPLPEGDSPQALSVRLSHPEWLIRRYLERFGREATVAYLERNNRPPLPAVWVNPFKISLAEFCRRLEEEEIPYRPCNGLPHGLIIEADGFVHHPLYREGKCFFMNPASQDVLRRIDLTGKQILGDFCAAPGSKSFLLASSLDPGARLFCSDASEKRLRQMRERARFLSVPNLHCFVADLTGPAPLAPRFEFILLDVPCSGLGTLRSNPDLRWKVREADLAAFQEKQLAILTRAFPLLVPGGMILYVTCSTEPEENEQVIEHFLRLHPAAKRCAPDYRTFPHDQPGDGFFSASLIRADEQSPCSAVRIFR